MYTNNEIVNAYFKDYLSNQETSDSWAYQELIDLAQQDPNRFLEVTILLVDSAPTEQALACVASGPLEDLLREHGLSFFDNIAAEARKNKRFLYALSGVWLDEEDDIFYPALEQLKREHHADQFNPLNGMPWSEANPRPN